MKVYALIALLEVAVLAPIAPPAAAGSRHPEVADEVVSPTNPHLVDLSIDPKSTVIFVRGGRGRGVANSSFNFVSAICTDCGTGCPPAERTVEVVLEANRDVAAGYGVSDMTNRNWAVGTVAFSTQAALTAGQLLTIAITGEVLACTRWFNILFSVCDGEPVDPTGECPEAASANRMPEAGELCFGSATFYGSPGEALFATLADLDGDMHLDLLLAGAASNEVVIRLGDGAGGLGPENAFPAGPRPVALGVGLFDGDQNLDVVAAQELGDAVAVLLGNGTGGLSAPLAFNVGVAPRAVFVTDFNLDGLPDVLAANAGSNSITFLGGTGFGFAPGVNFGVGTSPSDLFVGELSGDANLDVVVSNEGSNNFGILLGTGVGTLGGQTTIPAGTQPSALAVADFNGDDDLDVATSNLGTDDLRLRYGDGSGGFGAEIPFPVGSDPRSIIELDFDGDTNIDLAMANTGADTVTVLLGTGDGLFAPAQVFAVGDQPWGLAVGDLNEDGLADVAATCIGDSTLAVLLSSRCGPIFEDGFESGNTDAWDATVG